MKTKLLAIALIASSFLSASASSIVQFSGDTTCTGFNPLDALTVGVDIPTDAAWAKFVVYQNDKNVTHYKIVAGVLQYIPQDGTPAFPVPAVTDTAALQAQVAALMAKLQALEEAK